MQNRQERFAAPGIQYFGSSEIPFLSGPLCAVPGIKQPQQGASHDQNQQILVTIKCEFSKVQHTAELQGSKQQQTKKLLVKTDSLPLVLTSLDQ
jgi:hypothetical protein